MATTAITIINEDGDTLSFDGVASYTLTGSAEVTEHPVEGGADVSDHVQRKAGVLTCSRCVITETPWDNIDGDGGPDRVTRAQEFLDALLGTLCTVVTYRYGTLENMALQRFSAPADALRRLAWDLEFKQIRLAEAGLVDVPLSNFTGGSSSADDVAALDDASAASAQSFASEVDAGEQGTNSTEDEPEQEAADTSVLLDLLTAVGAEP